jgi:type II secretory pathway pseudopilin PulG
MTDCKCPTRTCDTEKEYLLTKDYHVRKRLATFGLIAILLVLALCSIGATVIIWQVTSQAREAVHMSDLDQQAHYFARAEDEHILLSGSVGRAKFHTTARQLVAVLMTIDQDGDAADRAFVQPLLAEQAHYLVLADQFFTMLDRHEIARAAGYQSAMVNPVIDQLDTQIARETTEEHQIAAQSLTDLDTRERIIIASSALVFAAGLFLLMLFARVVRGYQINEAVRRDVRCSLSKSPWQTRSPDFLTIVLSS